MRYMGSKNRLSKELAPIIQSYITSDTNGYLEPFVGGANMIDKIECKKRIGCDEHEELIALLKHSQKTTTDFPSVITFDHYKDVRTNRTKKYEAWYVGLVGFCSSYGGRYFDGGYGRRSKNEPEGKYTIDGMNNLKKQAPLLKDIYFKATDFRKIPETIKGYVIYCDIPYKGTKSYSTKKFPYKEFYKWCKQMANKNTVLVSEYNMPNDFECVWEKEHKTMIDCNANKNDTKRTEKLFIYIGGKNEAN